MTLTCSKRPTALVFCIFECLFLSGLLNGWTWMLQILEDEGYYTDTCSNLTMLGGDADRGGGGVRGLFNADGGKQYDDGDMGGLFEADGGIQNPFIHVHNGNTLTCHYKRVLKVVSVEEYANMQRTTHAAPESDADIQTVHLNNTAAKCWKQKDKLEFVITVVVIIRNMLMFPMGILLDKYGTGRARIIAIFIFYLTSGAGIFFLPLVKSPVMVLLSNNGPFPVPHPPPCVSSQQQEHFRLFGWCLRHFLIGRSRIPPSPKVPG